MNPLDRTDHRTSPLPVGPWLQFQTWNDMLFLHRPVSPAALRSRLPAGIDLDLHEGEAWLSVVAIRISGFRLHGFPALPGLSRFRQVNLRTYARVGAIPGVYFLSIDLSSGLAVPGMRVGYGLPAYRSRISIRRVDGCLDAASRRQGGGGDNAIFDARYRAVGKPFIAAPGSLDHWLAERYCLFHSRPGGRLFRTDIHHPPFPLREAEAKVRTDTLAAACGIEAPESPVQPPFARFVARLDALVWPPKPI